MFLLCISIKTKKIVLICYTRNSFVSHYNQIHKQNSLKVDSHNVFWLSGGCYTTPGTWHKQFGVYHLGSIRCELLQNATSSWAIYPDLCNPCKFWFQKSLGTRIASVGLPMMSWVWGQLDLFTKYFPIDEREGPLLLIFIY